MKKFIKYGLMIAGAIYILESLWDVAEEFRKEEEDADDDEYDRYEFDDPPKNMSQSITGVNLYI